MERHGVGRSGVEWNGKINLTGMERKQLELSEKEMKLNGQKGNGWSENKYDGNVGWSKMEQIGREWNEMNQKVIGWKWVEWD